jgi:hypothetical protein
VPVLFGHQLADWIINYFLCSIVRSGGWQVGMVLGLGIYTAMVGGRDIAYLDGTTGLSYIADVVRCG